MILSPVFGDQSLFEKKSFKFCLRTSLLAYSNMYIVLCLCKVKMTTKSNHAFMILLQCSRGMLMKLLFNQKYSDMIIIVKRNMEHNIGYEVNSNVKFKLYTKSRVFQGEFQFFLLVHHHKSILNTNNIHGQNLKKKKYFKFVFILLKFSLKYTNSHLNNNLGG